MFLNMFPTFVKTTTGYSYGERMQNGTKAFA